jgi:hypothetical protein
MPVVAETGELFQRFGGSPLGRGMNIFAFFTVQSNLIVGITSLLLAINPNRSSTVFSAFRLAGLVGITVTGVVFHLTLSGLFELDTWAKASDRLTHFVVSIMAVVGWMVFGPRGLVSSRVVKLAVLFPLAFMLFTIIRGPLASDWYPYPFANVKALGYPRVIINGVWISLLFAAVCAAVAWLDKRLPTKRTPTPQPVVTDKASHDAS